MPKVNNPVVEMYKGIPIRQSNTFKMRMGAVLYKTLILESERTGLPITKILSYSAKPCEKCAGVDVVAYNKEDEKVMIKRGILSNHMSQGSGTSKIKQHAKKQ